jgi:hypothetical protein
MLPNTKIFQIYYKPELKYQCDPAFTAYDNTANPRPELREWDVWDRFHQGMLSGVLSEELDMWGFVSWKFKEKTNLSGQQFVDFITANPGYDVYFVNPCIVNEAAFINSWEQGDIHHPNISAIGNSFLTKLGYEDVSVRDLVLDRTRTMFANYVVGTRDFWDRFMLFSNKLFTEAEKDPEFKTQVFGAGLSNYAHDKSLPNFTFLIERLIPTFIELEGFNALPYQYTQETVAAKYQPYFADIQALSDLKVLINQHESDELYTIWNHYRHKFLKDNPGILGLE